ncbi:MAG: hypothetical protein KDA17_07220, partial [Candidatus Saccharibacteria bacterium]|nr:hypothetical protein [Candidatus Saccharibacteria bacterium]
DGPYQEIEMRIDYAELESAGTDTILSRDVRLPNGAFVKSVTFEVEEAFDSSGDSATLSFGTIYTDGSTEHDLDGFDATIAETAIDAVGDDIVCDGAKVETELSTTGGAPVLLTATVGTEDFTAGVGYLRIKWYMPLA